MMYKIVQAESPKDLEVLVNKYLEKGYKLQGGVCVNQQDGYCWQAMTFSQFKL